MAGFLPFSNATLMLDVIVIAMIFVLPLHLWSVWRVRSFGDAATHRKVQLVLSVLLLTAVVLFAIELRWHGWRHLVSEEKLQDVFFNNLLVIHRGFSVSTSLLWLGTLAFGILSYQRRARRSQVNHWHRRLGWLTTLGLLATCITGWWFYFIAFIAS